MKIEKIFISSFSIVELIDCNNNDEPIKNAVSVKMYDANHGKTNLANMNVYLSFSLQNMRMTLLEEYKSLQDVNVSFVKNGICRN